VKLTMRQQWQRLKIRWHRQRFDAQSLSDGVAV
jgi:hypothetical protein